MTGSRTKYLFILLLITLVFSCKKETDLLLTDYYICGEKNPEWFIELIDSISHNDYYTGSTIYELDYNDSKYYHLEIPLSSCYMCNVYDCDGNLVDEADFLNYWKNEPEIIWQWPFD